MEFLKSHQRIIIALILIVCISITSIILVFQFLPKSKDYGNDANGQFTSFYDDFENYDSNNWGKLDQLWFGEPFNCIWRSSQVNFFAGDSINGMTLTLANDPYHYDTPDLPYESGELRGTANYGYGLYEVRMKPVLHNGVVSSFYVVTDWWDDYHCTSGSPVRPHDEVDIEFIMDPSATDPIPVMQCNYFTNHVGLHEYVVNLTFDATQEYHIYAFNWESDNITWYIDGVAVYTATENIPSHAGRLDMNLWPTIGVDQWAGHYDGSVPLIAYYDWVRYTPCSSIQN